VNLKMRFFVVVLLLGGTALFLQGRTGKEVIPARQSLGSFPQGLGAWAGRDVPIPQDALEVLGPGDFLLRVYRNQSQPEPYVDLFIAYFPSQRAGDTIHSPKHCLPGAGWLPLESSRIKVDLAGRPGVPMNRYVIGKGEDRQLVLYWYYAHKRAVASEYSAKFYLVTDAIRMNRSDGAMIRLTTPLRRGEDSEQAQQRLLSFANQLSPQLDYFIPR
jgi:EpsI family protein